MKRLLTIACVLFALAGAGQKDTAVANWMTYDTSTKRLFIYHDTTLAPQYDTIPIIYLYSDTARWITINDIRFLNDKRAYWDFGYEVRNGWHGIIGYLDRQKQPIRKSIVIFMTKAVTDPPGEN